MVGNIKWRIINMDKITGVAIKYKYKIYTYNRVFSHNHLKEYLIKIIVDDIELIDIIQNGECGFMVNNSEFVDRITASGIAENANQLIENLLYKAPFTLISQHIDWTTLKDKN